MPAAAPAPRWTLTFYPAYCHRASPTWNTWVKVTARDIHHVLRIRPGQSLFPSVGTAGGTALKRPDDPSTWLTLYYLNHPIQFVQVIGTLVNVEDSWPAFWLFTLDDSSGGTIDLIYPKPKPPAGDGQAADGQPGFIAVTQSTHAVTTSNPPEPKSDPLLPLLEKLECGAVVQAKGTLSSFRQRLQINLKRLNVIQDTNTELLHIQARSHYLLTVLNVPWTLTVEAQDNLLSQAKGGDEAVLRQAKRGKDRAKCREEREKRDAQEITSMYESDERGRTVGAERAKEAGVTLPRYEESETG